MHVQGPTDTPCSTAKLRESLQWSGGQRTAEQASGERWSLAKYYDISPERADTPRCGSWAGCVVTDRLSDNVSRTVTLMSYMISHYQLTHSTTLRTKQTTFLISSGDSVRLERFSSNPGSTSCRGVNYGGDGGDVSPPEFVVGGR